MYIYIHVYINIVRLIIFFIFFIFYYFIFYNKKEIIKYCTINKNHINKKGVYKIKIEY